MSLFDLIVWGIAFVPKELGCFSHFGEIELGQNRKQFGGQSNETFHMLVRFKEKLLLVTPPGVTKSFNFFNYFTLS